MADVLRLANVDQSTTVDLIDGTLKLREKSWITSSTRQVGSYNYSPYGPQWEFENYDPMVETMDLIGDTAATNLRAAFDEISDILEKARGYHQYPIGTVTSGAVGPESWWLEWNSDGESAKRALLYEGGMDVLQGVGISPFLEQDAVLARLSVTRHPFWEATSPTSFSHNTMSNFVGSSAVSSIPGNVPARLQKVLIEPGSGSNLNRLWMGIREEGYGVGNFEPLWECEDGNVHNFMAVAVDATASGGSKTYITNPPSTLTLYWQGHVQDICTANGHADYTHQIGRYLVLLRAKVDTGTVGVEMRTGYYDPTVAGQFYDKNVAGEMQFVDSTSWYLYPMGEFSVPLVLVDGEADADAVKSAGIYLYVQQISGSSTLDIDALALIPLNHFAYVDNTRISFPEGDCAFFTQPNDVQYGYSLYSDLPFPGAAPSFDNWYLPTGNSVVVFAGMSAWSALSQNVNITYYYYPRWMLYRYGYST